MTPYLLLAKVAAGLGLVLALIGIGWHAGSTHTRDKKDAEIAKINGAYDDRIRAADAAKTAAEAKATETEHATTLALSAADSKHTKELHDANAKTTAAVAAYRAGSDRLRYLVPADASGGRTLPGLTATASRGNGGAVAELPREIAGSLSALAGEADDTVIQLGYAQETIRAYYAACGKSVQ